MGEDKPRLKGLEEMLGSKLIIAVKRLLMLMVGVWIVASADQKSWRTAGQETAERVPPLAAYWLDAPHPIWQDRENHGG